MKELTRQLNVVKNNSKRNITKALSSKSQCSEINHNNKKKSFKSTRKGRISERMLFVYFIGGIGFMISFVALIWFFAFTVQSIEECYSQSSRVVYFLLVSLLYLGCICQRNEYFDLFDKLNKIIEKRTKIPAVTAVYRDGMEIIESLTSVLELMIVYLLTPIFMMSTINTSFINYYKSNYSRDSFQLFYPGTYPFDCKTPGGYIECITIQMAAMFAGSQALVCSIVLLIGFCFLVSNFLNDIKSNIKQLNQAENAAKDGKLSAHEHLKMKLQLVDTIKFQSEAKQFVERFMEANSKISQVYKLFVLTISLNLFPQINKSNIILNQMEQLVRALFAVAVCAFGFYIPHYLKSDARLQFKKIGKKLQKLTIDIHPPNKRKDLLDLISMEETSVNSDHTFVRKIRKKILNIVLFYFTLFQGIIF